MRSLSSLRLRFAQLSLQSGSHAFKTSKMCFSSTKVKFDGLLLSPSTAAPLSLTNTAMQNNLWDKTMSVCQPFASFLQFTGSHYDKDVQLLQSCSNTSVIGDATVNSVIGDVLIIDNVVGDSIIVNDSFNKIGDITEDSIMGYQPAVVNCSSVLKTRKRKMNKHKYKKRRKRDKFKRRNLENIRDRKKRIKEKADERIKAALV